MAAVPAGQDGSWYAAGSTVELSASAAEGWRFDQWDDGGVEPVRVVELAGPVSATAQFVEQAPSEVVLLQLAKGWNLVSTPVEPLAPARDAVFPPATIAAVWTHGNPGGYTVPDAIHAKRGYWVLATQAVALEIEGVRPSDHTVALTDGWNLIGIVADTPGGSQPVPASAAAVWQYDNPGGYTNPTECAEGKGFWVLVE